MNRNNGIKYYYDKESQKYLKVEPEDWNTVMDQELEVNLKKNSSLLAIAALQQAERNRFGKPSIKPIIPKDEKL